MRVGERIPLHAHTNLNDGGRLTGQSLRGLIDPQVAAAPAVDNATPTSSAPGDVADPGSNGGASHSDHRHGRESGATPSGGYGTAAAGSAATVLLSDAVLPKPTAADVDFSADVTTNNATSSAHGLLPKLAGGSAKFLREDGTWQLVGAASVTVFRGCKAYHSTTQSLTTATYTSGLLDSEEFDTDNFHFTSVANLTGTVATMNGSAAIAGTGTHFTTELSVNQVVTIGTLIYVVKVITDDTHFTAWQTAGSTASGLTAQRRNEYIAIPAGLGGFYLLNASTSFATNGTGTRIVAFTYNTASATPNVRPGNRYAGNASQNVDSPNTAIIQLNEGDYIGLILRQDSGGNLNAGDASNVFFQTQFSLTRLG